MISTPQDLWSHGFLVWTALGPPLRPSAEDIVNYQRAVSHRNTSRHPPKAIVLGATPEFATLDWPNRTELIAIDRNADMLDQVWPSLSTGERRTLCSDWLDLDFKPASRDIVLGDGSLTPLRFPDEYSQMFALLHRLLSRRGRLVLRMFVQTEPKESPAEVLQEMCRARISNFHEFKLRLAMSLQDDATTGISLDAVWQAWRSACATFQFAHAMRASDGDAVTIEWYRGRQDRYHFPTLAQARDTYSEWFDEVDIFIPTYKLGQRCPIVSLTPKATA